jgi:S1-C subfamily serine protease
MRTRTNSLAPTSGPLAHPLGRLSLGGGLLALAFAAGRTVGPAAGDAPGVPAPLEASDAARLVSEALQAVAATCEPSVLQVRALARSRRGGTPRRLQDGSGVALSADGVVVTNEHVVRGADLVQVILADGSVHAAEVLGRDPRTDLAVLRVTSVPLRPMPLAEAPPRVGELVLAMGNPLGFGHTVTLGVVNGVGRSNLDIAQYEDYIQTDAAINPGNSGGPLVDLEGRAVGINVAMGLESNGDDGLAFAIPAHMVRRVVDQIVAEGAVRHAWLGASIHFGGQFQRAAAADLAAGFTGRSRIKLRGIDTGSPAEQAGLLNGDILVAIGSRRLTDEQSFRNAVLEARPGDAVDVVLWRAGKELVLPVVFGEEQR